MTPTLEVRDLAAGYGGPPVVEGVSFRLDQGVVVLAGPNGAGKTTVLRVLATLLPFGGSVSLSGCDLSTSSGRRRARAQLGFLPQEAAFPDDFTVAEAVAYAAWLQRVPAGADVSDASRQGSPPGSGPAALTVGRHARHRGGTRDLLRQRSRLP